MVPKTEIGIVCLLVSRNIPDKISEQSQEENNIKFDLVLPEAEKNFVTQKIIGLTGKFFPKMSSFWAAFWIYICNRCSNLTKRFESYIG